MHRISYLTVLVVWGTTLLSSVTLAQTLTLNVDEPGRNPYQSVVTLFDPNASGTNCSNTSTPNFCFVSHTPVPAGKRLVVTYASTRFSASDQFPYKSVAIQGFHIRTFLPAPSLIGNNNQTYIAAGPISAYFEENDTPQMLIEGLDPQFPGIEAALVGYLVSVQQ